MIEPDKRKAIFLLHQEDMPLRELSRRFGLGRNTVRRIIAQEGRSPARSFTPAIDPELLRQVYAECHGYVQRVFEKLQEEHGLKLKYSTLTRWLRLLGISLPVVARCDRVPDQPGAEMQHDTSPFTIALGQTPAKLQASLLYLRYSKRRYLQFYRVFDRFQMKCFLHRALLHWGYAPPLCVIDNTNLARLRGLGPQAVIVPEMEAFAKSYGFRFLCHAPKHCDRKAGEERSFFTVETFPFARQPKLNRKAIMALYDTMDFIPKAQNIIWLGGTGVGKTGLATSFLVRAIQQGCSGRYALFAELITKLYHSVADHSQERLLRKYIHCDVLHIDEPGYIETEPVQVALFFTLMQRRHKKKPTLITSNLGFREWGSFLKNDHLTAALIDRLTECSHVFNMRECESLRPKLSAQS